MVVFPAKVLRPLWCLGRSNRSTGGAEEELTEINSFAYTIPYICTYVCVCILGVISVPLKSSRSKPVRVACCIPCFRASLPSILTSGVFAAGRRALFEC